MATADYAEVLRSVNIYRQTGTDPGVKLRAQEIAARALLAGNPGAALGPLGKLIVEAGPEHDFYRPALKLYLELERSEQARRGAEVDRARAEAERREQARREQIEQEQRRLAAARAEREAADRRAREDAQRQAFIAEVQAAVLRRWRIPEGTRASDDAIVLVFINPSTGRILSFDVQRCAGSAAFCESVRQTMERLQSLPRPPDAESVRGGIRIRFSPESG